MRSLLVAYSSLDRERRSQSVRSLPYCHHDNQLAKKNERKKERKKEEKSNERLFIWDAAAGAAASVRPPIAIVRVTSVCTFFTFRLTHTHTPKERLLSLFFLLFVARRFPFLCTHARNGLSIEQKRNRKHFSTWLDGDGEWSVTISLVEYKRATPDW